MTGQDIINSVSQDIRNLLSTSGAESNILLDYVDRIHKDVLHNSIYQYLVQSVTTLATVSGTSNYTLAPSNIRRLVAIYDRTRDRVLLPMDALTGPVSQREKSQDAGSTAPMAPEVTLPRVAFHTALQTGQPEFYRHIAGALYLFPTPTQILSIDIYYDTQIPTIGSAATTLTPPDDAKDVMVAGVNYLACSYLKLMQEAAAWHDIYERLSRGGNLV